MLHSYNLHPNKFWIDRNGHTVSIVFTAESGKTSLILILMKWWVYSANALFLNVYKSQNLLNIRTIPTSGSAIANSSTENSTIKHQYEVGNIIHSLVRLFGFGIYLYLITIILC